MTPEPTQLRVERSGAVYWFDLSFRQWSTIYECYNVNAYIMEASATRTITPPVIPQTKKKA